MKSTVCILLLIIVLCTYPSLQCNCNNKCDRCCSSRSGQYRLVPLYELVQPKNETYFYTVSLREINDAVKNWGFIRKNVIGLAAVSGTDCKKEKSLVPVRRYFNNDNMDYLYQFETDEAHGGKKTNYKFQSIGFYGASVEEHCGARIPLYRFWNGKHYLCATDLVEGKEKAGPNGVNEGRICYIWPAPNTSTTTTSTTTTTTTTTSTTTTTTTTTTRDPLENPGNCSLNLTKLFRLYRASSDSHLYTISYTEAVNAYQNLAYNPQKSPGFVAPQVPSCRCNLKPVYRVNRAEPKEDHLFTTSEEEAKDAVSKLGYTSEGIAYYCAEKLGDCGANIAYHRYKRNNSQQNHFYTADLTEGTKDVVGGTYEGILCYIWLE